ncbi:hypothetical protein RUND412_005711 [Rhizina undulata]
MAHHLSASANDMRIERLTSMLSPPMFSIVPEILAYLPRRDLFNTMLVCRGLYHVAHDQLYRKVKIETTRRAKRASDENHPHDVDSRRVESWKIMLLLERLSFFRDESIRPIVHSLALRVRQSDLDEERAPGNRDEIPSSKVIDAIQTILTQALLEMPCLQHLSLDFPDIPVGNYGDALCSLLSGKDYAHQSSGRGGLKTLAWRGSLRKFPHLSPRNLYGDNFFYDDLEFESQYQYPVSPLTDFHDREMIPDLRELSITAFWDEDERYLAYPWFAGSDNLQRYECLPVPEIVEFFSRAPNLRNLSLLDFRWHDMGEILKAATCSCYWIPGYSSWIPMEEEQDIASLEHTHHFHHLGNLSVLKISRMVEITPNLSSFLLSHPKAAAGKLVLEVDSLRVSQTRCVDWCNSERHRKRWNLNRNIQILAEIMRVIPVKLLHTELEPVVEEAVTYSESEISKNLKFRLKETGLWDKLVLGGS